MNTIEREQNLFMASISHELRTPLTSILGYGELLHQTTLDPKQNEYLERMLHSSKYLLSLVGDFLDIVKLKNNDISLDEKEVRLHTVLTECADVIKANLNKNVYFDVDIPFLDYTVKIDERRLKQVMLNLLSNAAKFTHTGSIKFYVKELTYNENDISVIVNIEDTGIGMSKEVQEALFNPFITGDSTQGFGLGLFISKEIIRLMQGEIQVDSHEGKGSLFSVSFKAKKSKEKRDSEALRHKNILMLSDNNEYTQHFTSQLKAFHATLQYHSASQDIAHTLRNILSSSMEYDIALFDLTTMDTSIPDIIPTLRMLHPRIQCIALKEKNQPLTHSHFDKVISLPIAAQNLIFELEALLAKDKKVSTSIDFSHLKVLIVEDVEMNREYIQEMFLTSFSIECDTAIHGKEAVEKVKNSDYDIVFMDIRMPVMNGYEATQAIRQFNTQLPIICMSADVFEKDIQAAKTAGMNDFIEKPLNKEEIKQSFLNLMGIGTNTLTGNFDPHPKTQYKESDIDKEGESCVSLRATVIQHLSENFDNDIIEKLLLTAIESLESNLHSVTQHCKEKEYALLADDFHAIKGLLANLGLKEESQQAGELQTLLREEKNTEIHPLKERLMEKLTHFLEELKQYN